MSEQKKKEDMTAEEALEVFKKGKKVRVAPTRKKDRMSVYNLRVENETLDGLMEIASKEDKPPSVIARGILKEGVQERLGIQEQVEWPTWNAEFFVQASNFIQMTSFLDACTAVRNFHVSLQPRRSYDVLFSNLEAPEVR